MKLLTLLKDLPSHTLTGSPQVKISHLECDSRRILPGSCYIALKGTRADGHEFIPEAIRRGACAVVAEMPCTQEAREAGVSWVEVNDSRLAVSLMGAAWNGRPSRHMTMIGVTGTNGKTTTAYIAHSLLKQSWLRAGLIGTIAYDNGEEITPSTHTTPGPLELEHLLKEMYENGCRGVSMEVSSHALDQERVAGINFNVGIFTNLTQDHLDYHHTMENYFQAKAKLFEQMAQDTRSRRKPVAVINIDDAYGRRLAEMYRICYNGLSKKRSFTMAVRYTEEQLNTVDKSLLIQMFLNQQEQQETLTAEVRSLNEKMQLMMEQMVLANRNRFGRSSEKMEDASQISFMEVDGTIVFFNEAEAVCNMDALEPEQLEVPTPRPVKKKGKKEQDMSGLPIERIDHYMTEEELTAEFGKNGWKLLLPTF